MITTKIADQDEIADIVELEEIEAQKLIMLINTISNTNRDGSKSNFLVLQILFYKFT
jgi:hypothetical protein